MHLSRTKTIGVLFIGLLSATALQAEVTVSQSGENLTIANELIQLNYDLSRGMYDVIDLSIAVRFETKRAGKQAGHHRSA